MRLPRVPTAKPLDTQPPGAPSTIPPASGERLTDLARAIMTYDATGDRLSSARARLALGQALLAAGEPSAREVLEDAGTCFEDLGDDPSMHEVDLALRDAAHLIEESPRSFHTPHPLPRK